MAKYKAIKEEDIEVGDFYLTSSSWNGSIIEISPVRRVGMTSEQSSQSRYFEIEVTGYHDWTPVFYSDLTGGDYHAIIVKGKTGRALLSKGLADRLKWLKENDD
jgi:hypothetical protein